jgi:hypothetical protein
MRNPELLAGCNDLTTKPLFFTSWLQIVITVQSNPNTAPLYISPLSYCTRESLGTEISYVISKEMPW